LVDQDRDQHDIDDRDDRDVQPNQRRRHATLTSEVDFAFILMQPRRIRVRCARSRPRGHEPVPEPAAPTAHPQLRAAPHLSPDGLSRRTPARIRDSELLPAKAPPGLRSGDPALRGSPATACAWRRPGSQLEPPAAAARQPAGVARHSAGPPRKHFPSADDIAPEVAVPLFPGGSAVHPASADAGGCRPSCAQTLRAAPARSVPDAPSAAGTATRAPTAGTNPLPALQSPAATGSPVPPPLTA